MIAGEWFLLVAFGLPLLLLVWGLVIAVLIGLFSAIRGLLG